MSTVMDTTTIADRLVDLAAPWPCIFAADFGRYLLAATLVTVIIVAAGHRYMRPRRVRGRPPDPNQRTREVRRSAVAALVFSLVGLGIYKGVAAGVFCVYAQVADYGWLYWTTSLVLIVIAHDAYFYWTHRLMHAPRLFRWMHRTHHLSVAPTQWAAYSFSISEALAQAAFLPLFLLVVPAHASVLFIWMAHQVLRNALGHSGVELEPASWLRTWWGRLLTTTLHHDLHHAHGRHNYGLYFTWWDRWCGTEHPEYRPRLAELLAGIDAPNAMARKER